MASPDYREEQAEMLTELRTIKQVLSKTSWLTMPPSDDAAYISRVREQLALVPSDASEALNAQAQQAITGRTGYSSATGG